MYKKIHVFRVKPGRELVAEIARYCEQNGITSGVVTGIIGSVERARLNFLMELPGKYDSIEYAGPLEIVGAQGSVALLENSPVIHIHIQLSGQNMCRGGHLAEAIIFSTAEVVIGELGYQMRRRHDGYTGLNELIE